MWSGRRPVIWAGYLCYAVALFALFTYLKFPGQQVRASVITALSHRGLGQVRIGAVQPLLPAGLTFREVTVTHDANGLALELMRMPELQVRLQSLRPFGNQLRIGFEGGLYGGTLLGTVGWEHNGKGPLLDIHVDLRDVRPTAHPLVTRLGDAIAAGKLTGTIALQFPNGRWQDGDGRLTLQGESGSIAGLAIGVVRLPSLAYDRITAELTLQQRRVVVKDLQMGGHDWQVAVQGHVSLNERLEQSLVDLTVRVHTSGTLEQQLGLAGLYLKQRRDRQGFTALKIGGTLEHPNPVL
jgi:type II secretion system protein N